MVKLPGPINVQTVAPPNINAYAANADAPARALADVGGALAQVGDTFAVQAQRQAYGRQRSEEELARTIDAQRDAADRETIRQQGLIDGTAVTEAGTGFDKSAGDEWTRAQKDDDWSEPGTLATFSENLSKTQADILKGMGPDVSGDARERARLLLDRQRVAAYQQAETMHVAKVKRRANDAQAESTNALSAQAFRNPDALELTLDIFNDRLENFYGLSADQRRDAFKNGTNGIITSGVNGLIEQKRFKDATAVLNNTDYDTVITEAQRVTLTNRIQAAEEAAKREAEAKAREAKAELQFNVSADLEDAKAAAENGEDWTRIVPERDIKAAYGSERGARVVDRLNFQQETGQQLKSVALATPEEEAAMVASAKPDVAREGYAAQDARTNSLAAAVSKKRDMLKKDPAAFVLAYVPSSRAMADKAFGQGGTQQDVAAYSQALIAEQLRLGVPERDVKPLTVAQADGIAGSISAADTPQKRLNAALPLLGFGEDRYVRRAIEQSVKAGATPDLPYALEAYRSGNASGATRIMQASIAPEVKLTGDRRTEVIEDASSAFEDYDEVLRTQSQWTGNPTSAVLAISQADLVARMTAITGNATQATADVTGHLRPIMDDNLAAVLVPQKIDVEGLRRGMVDKRAELLTKDVFASITVPGAPSVVQRYEAAVAEDLRDDSHWVNVGGRLGLALPGDVMLSDQSGRVLTFDPATLVKAAPTAPSITQFPDVQ